MKVMVVASLVVSLAAQVGWTSVAALTQAQLGVPAPTAHPFAVLTVEGPLHSRIQDAVSRLTPQEMESLLAELRGANRFTTLQQEDVVVALERRIQRLIDSTKPSVVKIQLTQGHGTGFVVDSRGLFLTNAHVAQGADAQTGAVSIVTHTGETIPGVVVAKDQTRDLALVRALGTPRSWTPLTWAQSEDLRVGRFAVSIGHPMSFDFSAGFGIITAIQRPGALLGLNVSFIQTSAQVNPGNSGGPLVAMDGKVLGVVDWKIVHPAFEGLGFAISAPDARAYSDAAIAAAQTAPVE